MVSRATLGIQGNLNLPSNKLPHAPKMASQNTSAFLGPPPKGPTIHIFTTLHSPARGATVNPVSQAPRLRPSLSSAAPPASSAARRRGAALSACDGRLKAIGERLRGDGLHLVASCPHSGLSIQRGSAWAQHGLMREVV